jgi:hypothetical protein
MKHILLTSIAAALCAFPAFGEGEKKNSTASSYSIVTSDGKGGGKATVTIEVNGKKETREIDLGGGNTKIEISSDDLKPAKTRNVVWLGVSLDDLPPAVAAQLPEEGSQGVLVTSVASESPAAAAGITKNDVITKVDDEVISNPKQLQATIAARKDGDAVRVSYFRRGQKSQAEAKLTTRVETYSSDANSFRASGLGGLGSLQQMLKGLGSGLSIDKEVIVVDKDGNVVSRENKGADKMERELARVRQQLEAVQVQVTAAAKRAEEAARAAAEAARKSLEKP